MTRSRLRSAFLLLLWLLSSFAAISVSWVDGDGPSQPVGRLVSESFSSEATIDPSDGRPIRLLSVPS
ncbi:MAG: hypothetical protein R8J94_08640 [Acidimicrobiia bacterium]|nr:hypothetical protein [Acidimicrobiia bacterium]